MKADALLHPVRMRIVQVPAQGRALTAQQLAEALTEVPQATPYRHLQKLVESGVLIVVDERQRAPETKRLDATVADPHQQSTH